MTDWWSLLLPVLSMFIDRLALDSLENYIMISKKKYRVIIKSQTNLNIIFCKLQCVWWQRPPYSTLVCCKFVISFEKVWYDATDMTVQIVRLCDLRSPSWLNIWCSLWCCCHARIFLNKSIASSQIKLDYKYPLKAYNKANKYASSAEFGLLRSYPQRVVRVVS